MPQNRNPGRENNNNSNCYSNSSSSRVLTALHNARLLSGQGLAHDIMVRNIVDFVDEFSFTCYVPNIKCETDLGPVHMGTQSFRSISFRSEKWNAQWLCSHGNA